MKASKALTRGRVTHPYADPLVKETRRRKWLSWLAWGGSLVFFSYAFYLLLEHGARMTDGEQVLLGIGTVVVGLVMYVKRWGR